MGLGLGLGLGLANPLHRREQLRARRARAERAVGPAGRVGRVRRAAQLEGGEERERLADDAARVAAGRGARAAAQRVRLLRRRALVRPERAVEGGAQLRERLGSG